MSSLVVAALALAVSVIACALIGGPRGLPLAERTGRDYR